MRFGRLIFALALIVAMAATAATAGARVGMAHKTTTITFWDAYSSDGPEVKRLEKVLIPQFEKEHPGLVVKDVTIPYDSLHQKLVTAVAGGQLPDLVRSDIIWVPELANLGVLQPLDTTLPDFKSISGKVSWQASRNRLLKGAPPVAFCRRLMQPKPRLSSTTTTRLRPSITEVLSSEFIIR